MTNSIQDYISALSQSDNFPELVKFGRGIEREALRVLAEGKLSEHGHYSALGSALTHPHITTDYSETLLEFITPVSYSAETAIAQLKDIQKYTFENIEGELLWPMSMPCFVNDADEEIQLAQYGSSNIGKMKTVYRQGLKNRYGSMMQVIAGIHFNFSFPESFWQTLKTIENNDCEQQEYISCKYFALLRNYKRYCWLIPYLYGSSPAICPSFLQGRETNLPFDKSKHGYLYLPYSTSLRMSDLGYTNSEQSSLHICYNHLDSYVSQVQKAISLASENFAEIGVKVDGEYQQLNANVLQIENELYAPIRPKRVAKSGEKPSHALKERGVEYIEVRALDVNPFADTGISIEQVYFLDIFLTYCALAPSEKLTQQEQEVLEQNMDEVVVRGRDPELKLNFEGKPISVKAWGEKIFADMQQVAEMLDAANNSDIYQNILANEYAKIQDSTLTPSAKLLDILNNQGVSLTRFALDSAINYREQQLASDYLDYNQQHFIDAANTSLEKQTEIEAADTLSFDDFLADYFARD